MAAGTVFSDAIRDIFEALGTDVFYTPSGGEPFDAPVKAMFSSQFNSQPSGMDAESWGQHTFVELMLADFPGGPPDRGDTVNNGIKTYTLEAETENDGLVVKWVVI